MSKNLIPPKQYTLQGEEENVYSPSNPPPYPVTSVNGTTGNVNINGYRQYKIIVYTTSGPDFIFYICTDEDIPTDYNTTWSKLWSVYFQSRTPIFFWCTIKESGGYTTPGIVYGFRSDGMSLSYNSSKNVSVVVEDVEVDLI